MEEELCIQTHKLLEKKIGKSYFKNDETYFLFFDLMKHFG